MKCKYCDSELHFCKKCGCKAREHKDLKFDCFDHPTYCWVCDIGYTKEEVTEDR